jgi:TP901 family phage tail tape measure protein
MSKQLKITLKVDAKTGKLTQVSNGFVKLDGRVKKTTKSLTSVTTRMSTFVKAAAGIYVVDKAVQKLHDSFNVIVEDFKTLEKASLEVQKTTGLAGDSLKTLTNELDIMSVTMNGFEIEGLYDIAASAGQLGIEGVDNIASFTKEMQYMASSSKLTAEQSAVGFAKLSNVLRVPIAEINRLTGAFSGLAASTNATESDLLNFTQRLSGAGVTFGLTNSQIIGLGATLADVGVNFETGGTAMTNMFNRMLLNGKDFANVMGIEMGEFSRLIKDEPQKAVEGFLSSLNKLDKQSRISALKHVKLDSAQAANTILKLSGNVGKLRTNLAIADEEYKKGNATLKEYLISSTSLEQIQMKNVNASKLFGRTIGEFLKPIMIDFSENSTNAMTSLTKTIGTDGTHSAQLFGQAIVDMSNTGLRAIEYLASAINGVIVSMRIAYAGYQKLTGFVGAGVAQLALNAREEALKERGRKLRENDFDLFGDDSNREKVIASMKEDTKWIAINKAQIEEYNDIRRSGDENAARAAEQYLSLQKGINETAKMSVLKDYTIPSQAKIKAAVVPNLGAGDQSFIDGLIKDVGVLEEVVEGVSKTFGKVEDSAKKSGKAQSQSLKLVQKEAEAYAKAQEKYLTGVSTDKENALRGLGNDINSLGKYFSNDELYKYYKNQIKKMEKVNIDFTDKFKGLLEGVFSGDFSGSIKGFFDGVGTDLLAEPINKMSESLSGGLNSLFSGLGSFGGLLGGAVSLGLGALAGSFFADTTEAPPTLGDNHKESDSILNALGAIEDVQYPLLEHTKKQTDYLRTISLAFGGIENSLLRSNVDIGGNLFQDSSKSGTLFGGKTYSLFGTSLSIGSGSIEDLINGEITALLDTVTKRVSTTWYGKKKTRYLHAYTDLSNDIGAFISDATLAVFDSLTDIGSILNVDTSNLITESISLGKIDTTGKSAEQVAKDIESRFSAELDGITEKYFGIVSEFQIAGETLGETLYRVITNFEQVSYSLDLINKSVDYRTANIIADTIGGLDNLGTALSSYTDNFFTEQEQYDNQLKVMTDSFKTLGVVTPKTKKDFRSLVEGIDTMSDSGAELFAEIIGLSDGFNELIVSAENLKDSTSDIFQSVADAYVGSLSYFTQAQKADYASGYLKLAGQSNGSISTVDAARLAVETALKTSSTKEDYIPVFERYIAELENQEVDATNTDLLNQLKELTEEVIALKQANIDIGIQA